MSEEGKDSVDLRQWMGLRQEEGKIQIWKFKVRGTVEVILGGCNLRGRVCVYVLCICDQAPLSRAGEGGAWECGERA